MRMTACLRTTLYTGARAEIFPTETDEALEASITSVAASPIERQLPLYMGPTTPVAPAPGSQLRKRRRVEQVCN
jgi:hypothetical protein